jgi:aerobic-type carbon monoxide dehydrogenase small subunit (CoxS/CutS family)
MRRAVSFTLNGRAVQLDVDDERPLLWVLRLDLGLTGTKFGCGEALCGACTVLVDDEAVPSCSVTVGDVQGKRVLTIEGLARGEALHSLQQAFVDHGAFQCGYCTPGMILSAWALLLRNPRPSDAEIVDHLDGNLCRCGSHVRVLRAVRQAAEAMREVGR